MILTENINLTDSTLFLLCARDIIKEVVNTSSIENKDTVKNFIVNEASDYQIMSLLINEELPEKKYDVEKEILLFSQLKEQVVFNYSTLTETIGENLTKNIIFEVGPISPRYSSAALIAEFLVAKRALEQVVTVTKDPEAAKKALAVIKTSIKFWKNKAGVLKNRVAAAVGPNKATLALQLKKANQKIASLEKQQGSITANLKRAGKLAVGKGKVASIAASGKVVAALQAIGAKTGAAGVAAKLGVPATSVGIVGGGAVVLGGLAAAAILTYAAVKTYKRFLSQAAKACKGKSGADKTACMKAYRIKGLQAQITDLNKALAGCAKTKDPGKCSKAVGNKLTSLKKKLAKIQK